MTTTARQRWLGGALAATLGATAITAWRSDAPAPAEDFVATRTTSPRPPDGQPSQALADRSGHPAAPASSAPGAAHSPSRQDDWPPVAAAALAAWGQLPAPPRQVRPRQQATLAAAAPAPPAAPPLTYRYVGRFVEDGRPRAMLVSPQRSLLVAEHELIDGQWRVERIADGQVDLLWLPGSQRGRLMFTS